MWRLTPRRLNPPLAAFLTCFCCTAARPHLHHPADGSDASCLHEGHWGSLRVTEGRWHMTQPLQTLSSLCSLYLCSVRRSVATTSARANATLLH